jgi:hypothetical protein
MSGLLLAVTAVCIAGLVAWLANRIWYRLTRVTIDIEAADARYLVPGVRLAMAKEAPDFGPFVDAMLPSSATEAVQLVVHVRLGVHNQGNDDRGCSARRRCLASDGLVRHGGTPRKPSYRPCSSDGAPNSTSPR